MEDGITIKIEGLEELKAAFRQLPAKAQTRVMKGMVATGCAIFKNDAIARAPQDTGVLKRAIYQTRMSRLCTPTFESWTVGVYKGKLYRHAGAVGKKVGPTQGVDKDAFYATWVEFGHYTRVSKKVSASISGRRRIVASGSQMVEGAHWVMPEPFMRPAFETKKSVAVSAMQQYLFSKFPDALDGISIIKWKR